MSFGDGIWASLVPVVTFALGLVGAIALEVMRERWSRRRDAAVDLRARSIARDARLEVFEIETLTAARIAVNDLMRQVVRHHLIDLEVARKNGIQYASRRLDGISGLNEIGESLRLAHVEIGRVTEWLLDASLRERVQKLSSQATALNSPMSVGEAEARVDALTLAGAEVQAMIGERVRHFYTRPPGNAI